MAWVQVGPHKINTALICYMDQEGESLRLYFQGSWEGNPLELHFDEAKAFWKHMKAENAMMVGDKGSATVLPRAVSSDRSPDVSKDTTATLAPVKPKIAPPAGSSSSSASPVVQRSIDSHKHGDHHHKKH